MSKPTELEKLVMGALNWASPPDVLLPTEMAAEFIQLLATAGYEIVKKSPTDLGEK